MSAHALCPLKSNAPLLSEAERRVAIDHARVLERSVGQQTVQLSAYKVHGSVDCIISVVRKSMLVVSK